MKKNLWFSGFLALWCGLSTLSAQVTIGADDEIRATGLSVRCMEEY